GGPTGTFALSRDGTSLAVLDRGADGNSRVRVHVLGVDELLAVARARVARSLTEDECRRYLQRACR
ncbi:MAG TPA: hypothetical protein VK926_02120, partial [Gaiellaceae bacterium]|nr:hypothetical protein [Gaiellaceae bacterium]